MKTINKKNHETNIRTREAKYCSIAEAKYCRMLWTIVYVWSTTDEKVRLIALRKKCFFLVRIFPYSDRIRRDTPYLSVLSQNAGKCGPEETPYLDTFHTVLCNWRYISLENFWLRFFCTLEKKFILASQNLGRLSQPMIIILQIMKDVKLSFRPIEQHKQTGYIDKTK